MTKTVMIVDDSNSLRHVVRIALESAGFEVREASDGKDALEKLTGDKVHLIISDVHMEAMDGLTFLKELKQHPVYKFTPVIMLTTESEIDKIDQGRAAGAKAWVCKPFDAESLLKAVKKLVLP